MLKSIYRRYISCLNNISQEIRVKKQWLYEWYSVFFGIDSRITWKTHLTREQKMEVQQYWKKIYGKRIPLYWHRNYLGFTGQFDKRYIPDYLYTTKLEPKCNPDRIARVLNDKSLTEFLFAKVIDQMDSIVVPKTLGGGCRGLFYDKNHLPVTKRRLLKELACLQGEYIIKPCVGESSGNHVRLLQLKNGIDLKGQERMSDIIHEYRTDFIIQKRVQLHETYAKLHPKSCNTLRVMTYRVRGKIKCAPIVLRIGKNDSYLDNAHAGGLYVAVTDEGKLGKYAYDCNANKYASHPATGIMFQGYCVPYIETIIKVTKQLHICLPNLVFLNWDLCVDSKGQIVIIECNMSCAGIWILQKAHGAGVFGEDTEYMMRLIRDK